MYVITGITGQVGGATARALLADGKRIRAVVRDASKAQEWIEAGAEIAVADFNDAAALEAAFDGAEGAFIMIPANFAPSPGFPEPRAIIAAMRSALAAAKPGRVVALSSVGAQHATGLGLITQLQMLESALGTLPGPAAFVRPAWFMENSLWDIPTVQHDGKLTSFLSPLDRAFPMVATSDIGRSIADLLQQTWTGKRIVELEGPRRYSQNDIAAIFAKLTGRTVEPVPFPREQWAGHFEAQGTPANATAPRIEMLDGFNSGWIDFEGEPAERVTGTVTLEQVLAPALT